MAKTLTDLINNYQLTATANNSADPVGSYILGSDPAPAMPSNRDASTLSSMLAQMGAPPTPPRKPIPMASAPSDISSVVEVPKVSTLKPVAPVGDYTIKDLKPHLIQAESSGNPKAVSTKKAYGLMQIQPETAKEQAKLMGLEWLGKKELLSNPQYNETLGTGYLERLSNKFGDVRLALAAYNWGPTALGKLIARKKTTDFEALFPHMPSETKNYVNKIIGNANQTFSN